MSVPPKSTTPLERISHIERRMDLYMDKIEDGLKTFKGTPDADARNNALTACEPGTKMHAFMAFAAAFPDKSYYMLTKEFPAFCDVVAEPDVPVRGRARAKKTIAKRTPASRNLRQYFIDAEADEADAENDEALEGSVGSIADFVAESSPEY